MEKVQRPNVCGFQILHLRLKIWSARSNLSHAINYCTIWLELVSITGDNSLRIDEIGIPIQLAQSLQIPETVRSYNKDRLSIYYLNKRDIYPGCSGIHIKQTNKFHRIENLDPTYELQEGDVLHRDLLEGDYVGFNRQPSLLFGNIGSHKIKIMEKSSTIRINVSSCAPYNADSQKTGFQINSRLLVKSFETL